VSVLRRDFAAVLLWAGLLTGLTAAQLAFMREPYSYGLLGGAALATFLLGLALSARRPREAEKAVPELSYATVAFGIGAALAVIGAPLGPWLFLPGLGLLALGAGGLVREYRAGRRRLRQ
jgi:hypothetical protein